MRLFLAALLLAGCARMAPQETLAGTSWQLVRFQGGGRTGAFCGNQGTVASLWELRANQLFLRHHLFRRHPVV
jgi:hypothetical protein